MKSIIQKNRGVCFFCGCPVTEVHHCWYGTANRALSDEDGLVVDLCPLHHRLLHEQGYGAEELKLEAERAWIKHYGKTEADFIKRYGKSVLNGRGIL